MYKVTVIQPDGVVTVTEHADVPLEMLQRAVGGFIQMVPHFTQYDGHPCEAYVNEEGRLKNMPLNAKATALWEFFLGEGPFQYKPLLFGPLVIKQKV